MSQTVHTQHERLATLRDCAWALLGLVHAETWDETPTCSVADIITRLERVREAEGRDDDGAGPRPALGEG